MRQTTRITIEHVVVASNQPYEKVLDAFEARLGPAEHWEEITRQLLLSKASWELVTQTIEEHIGASGLTFFFKIEIAAWAIVTGIMQIVGAFTLPLGTGREWLLGLAGLFSILFGVLIAIRPVAGLVTVVWLIGIYAIVFGILFIVRYLQARALASRLT